MRLQERRSAGPEPILREGNGSPENNRRPNAFAHERRFEARTANLMRRIGAHKQGNQGRRHSRQAVRNLPSGADKEQGRSGLGIEALARFAGSKVLKSSAHMSAMTGH